MSEDTFDLIETDNFSLGAVEPPPTKNSLAKLDWHQLLDQAVSSTFSLAENTYKFLKVDLEIRKLLNKLTNKSLEFNFHPFDLETPPDMAKIKEKCYKKYENYEYWDLLEAVVMLEVKIKVVMEKHDLLQNLIEQNIK